MVGECVRFLFTSCEGSLNERVSAANESYKRTNHEVICLLYEYKDERIEIRIYDTDKNKHTSKISKWNFLPFIALFSC